MNDLTILSIFRQSESYIRQYILQVEEVFARNGGSCSAVWLEGDSRDNTYSILLEARKYLESKGHHVTVVKSDCGGPYWRSIANEQRWRQLSSCWNTCLGYLGESKHTVCVESDIRYEPSVVEELIKCLDEEHHVIYPMLMMDTHPRYTGPEIFYDTWGFSIDNKRFKNLPPYYSTTEEGNLIKLTSGGGMIVSTYEHQRHGRFGSTNCIMQYGPETNLFMNTDYKIYHPEAR